MIDAEGLSSGRAGGKFCLAALVFFICITASGLPDTLAAGPDLRPQPAAAKAASSGRLQNSGQQSQPRKPVKIKLHHNAKGDYTWDLAGENVEEILRVDRRLRKAFDSSEETQK